jgi:hypothetical protein
MPDEHEIFTFDCILRCSECVVVMNVWYYGKVNKDVNVFDCSLNAVLIAGVCIFVGEVLAVGAYKFLIGQLIVISG